MLGSIRISEVYWHMSSKLNIGVLGCANIAGKAILPAIKKLSSHYNLVGVSSRTKKKADEFANTFSTKSYYEYEDLLSNKDLDAIYIPLPNSLHREWVEKALCRGLHVLVEKSMACNLEDVITLNQMATDKNLLLMENFQFRFHPQLEVIKKLLDSGEIGALRSVKSTFAFPPFSTTDNIRYNAALGGGALLDAGAYPLKILQVFLGSGIKVLAATSHFDASKCVDLWGSAFLGSDDDSVGAHMNFGFDNYYQCEIELVGSLGRIFTDRIFTAPATHAAKIELYKTHSGRRTINLEPSNHFENILVDFKEKIVQNKGFAGEYRQNLNQARLISEFRERAELLNLTKAI